MRLICPKCDAQYEIDDGVIPPEGRDVQCSNCSTTWFQTSSAVVSGKPTAEVNAPEADAPARDAKAAAKPDEAPASAAEAEEAPLKSSQDNPAVAEPIDAVAAELADDTPEAEPEPAPALKVAEPKKPEAEPAPKAAAEPVAAMVVDDGDGEQRRIMDDSVVNILREEADRETKARKSDASALEYEAELGLAVMAAIAADNKQDSTQDDGTGKGGRRSVLPDIDQINSTLRATSDRIVEPVAAAMSDVLPKRRAGFRRGFVTILAMAMVLLGIYTTAPRLAARFPAAEPALSVYVTQVDRGRLWLDQQMKMANLWMTGDAAQP